MENKSEIVRKELDELMHRYDCKTGNDRRLFDQLYSQILRNDYYETKNKTAQLYYERLNFK